MDAQMETRLRAQLQSEEARLRAQRRNESRHQQQLQHLQSQQQPHQQVLDEEQTQQIIVTVNEPQQTGQHQASVKKLQLTLHCVLAAV